ncbi:MAG: hypothetical protein MI757_07490, partial [Pirellulales bacterium]|nr:hypothetical protein [Pirellulales bacterium]
QTLAEAARAGCRLYALQTTTEQQATDIIDEIMSNANITGYTITFDPADRSTITTDRVPVTCSVSVPFANVDWLGAGWFVSSEPLAGICIMPSDAGIYVDEAEPEPEPTPTPEHPPATMMMMTTEKLLNNSFCV